MIKTISTVDNYIQSLSVSELKAWSADSKPVDLNYTDEEIEKSKKIFDIQDLTDLDYADIERLLDNPKLAPLCDIEIYCKALNIDMFEFIKKALI